MFSKCPIKQAISSLHSSAHTSQAIADTSNNVEQGPGAEGGATALAATGGTSLATDGAAGAAPAAAGAATCGG
ncbi:hypothetical protein DUNSADRAFT_16426, partial [Dunaliella salina]